METIRLTPDFKEFLNLLKQNGVNFLLIGGYAVGLYGVMRPTKDMDIWIAVHNENLALLIRVLEQFGFRPGSIHAEQFRNQHQIFRMGVPPNRLEILTSIPGVDFVACASRANLMKLDGLDVPVISRDDLIANKRATGRMQDLSDVEKLLKRVDKER